MLTYIKTFRGRLPAAKIKQGGGKLDARAMAAAVAVGWDSDPPAAGAYPTDGYNGGMRPPDSGGLSHPTHPRRCPLCGGPLRRGRVNSCKGTQVGGNYKWGYTCIDPLCLHSWLE